MIAEFDIRDSSSISSSSSNIYLSSFGFVQVMDGRVNFIRVLSLFDKSEHYTDVHFKNIHKMRLTIDIPIQKKNQ
ncbi:hypothetical protein JTB14_012152 [Gonioctena quinquepunctata]|nr:hypothetical protein JTB14_012152 [Gonioctena quinquepunctata]